MRLAAAVAGLACLIAVSCTRESRVERPSEPTSASPSPSVAVDAGGGLSPREPGDTSPEQFEGIVGVTEVKRLEMQPVILREIRTGRHPKFDRVVFEFEGNQVPGYRIEYVDKPLRTCGAGEIVQVIGYGYLAVQMAPAQAHTNEGKATIKERSFAPNLLMIKELRLLCDFEADVEWVLGLSSPNRYRALELSNPARLVVDVRH